MLIVSQHEHGTRQNGGPVGYDPRPGIFDCQRGPVVWVDAHPPCTKDDLSPRPDGPNTSVRKGCGIIVKYFVKDDLDAKLLNLFFYDGREPVLNKPVKYFASSRKDRRFFQFKGKDLKNRGARGNGLCPFHLFLLNDERNHAGPCDLIALFYRSISMPGGDHHFSQAVDGGKPFSVHLQEAVTVRNELDLPLAHTCRMHICPRADFIKDPSGFILVEHIFIFFPYVKMLLAYAEEDRNVLFCNNMALFKSGSLIFSGDDLRHIVTQHMPFRFSCIDQLHIIFLSSLIRKLLLNLKSP